MGEGLPIIGRDDEGKSRIANVNNDGDLKVQQTGSNDQLLAPETLTWNGDLTEQTTADINVTGKNIAVRIDNQADQALTVTFEHKNGTDYIDYYGADGNELTFDIPATTERVFAPIQAFPKFDGGRIVVTASTAPTDTDTTIIEVLEV